MLSLYIHIPFCISKCKYCDFVSYEKRENLIDKYLQYLNKEKLLYKESINENIETVYLGGGTPSLLNIKQLEKVSQIVNSLNASPSEFSIELNPDSITEEKLIKYKSIGINRISVGLQTTKDRTLKILSRNYTYKEFVKKYELCTKYFDNINLDLMYGLPNQVFEDFINDIKRVLNLQPKHISIYELHLKDFNPLKKLLPNDDVVADMYEYLLDGISGYKQYEISNWSKKGYQCKHNLNYWNNGNYIGLGIAAGGHIGNLRYINVKTFKEYFSLLDSKKKPYKYYQNDYVKYVKESIIMNLRLTRGLKIEDFNRKFNKDFLKEYKDSVKKLQESNLCKIENGYFKLTKKGIILSNLVYEHFV